MVHLKEAKVVHIAILLPARRRIEQTRSQAKDITSDFVDRDSPFEIHAQLALLLWHTLACGVRHDALACLLISVSS